tara:strand:+ start:2668 stop:3417 length:750 start_codon:yes stop_codon:yes gene_type:complete
MLINNYKSGKNDIEIHIESIELLFTKYKDSYIKTFQLDQDQFVKMKKFKLNRSGNLIVIKVNSKDCGFFTISLLNKFVGEFGDLHKISRNLSREDFADAISIGIKFALKKLALKGVYSYQNNNALSLVSLAGFKRATYYERHLSIVFLNFIFKLPIKIINRKLSFTYKPILESLPIRFKSSLIKTRLSRNHIPYVRLIREDEDRIFSLIFIGLLNEYHETDENGDPLMVFGNLKNHEINTGFEYSDNSA